MLTLAVAGQRLGVPTRLVREVARMPRLTRVPHAPATMLGLANVRGVVLPVMSLAALTGRRSGGERKLVVLDAAEPMALAVDAVAGLVEAGDASVEPIDALALISRSAAVSRPARATIGIGRDSATREDAATVSLVCFAIGSQAFALHCEDVEEVMRLPFEIAAIPNAAPMVLGSADVRGALLPLVLLAHLLELPGDAVSSRTRVLVVRIGAQRVGVVVDSMRGILRVAEADVDPVPVVLTRGDAEARIQAVCRAGGGRLISVLAPKHLLRQDITAQLLQDRPLQPAVQLREHGISESGSEQFLLFTVGDATFRLPIAAVEQVAAVPTRMARLPRSPTFVRGVMQFRGEAIAIIDQARRFGAPTGNCNGTKQRIVIVKLGNRRAGFLVDAASEIRRMPVSAIQQAPQTGADAMQVFGQVAVQDGAEPMLILSPAELLDRTERDLLDAMAMPSS